MKLYPLFFAIALIVVSVFTGCKKDEDDPVQPPVNNTPTTYVGTIASATESGTISFVVAASSLSESHLPAVTGTLRLVGTSDTIPLAGTLNGDTLDASGGGYTFDGALSGGSMSGSYTGPNGNGSFVANPSTSSGAGRVFVGSYAEDAPGTEQGTFNMVINANNSIDVLVVNSNNETTPFDGTLNGNAISVYVVGTPSAVIATGTLSDSTVSGTYNTGKTTGTWGGTQF